MLLYIDQQKIYRFIYVTFQPEQAPAYVHFTTLH